MKISDWLSEGEEALSFAENVFTEAAPVVEQLVKDGVAIGQVAQKLFIEAKAAFEQVKASGIAGTDTGDVAAGLVQDVTYMFKNATDMVGGDATKLAQVGAAVEAQYKLLQAQFAGGIKV